MSDGPKKCDCCGWAFWQGGVESTCGLCRRGKGLERRTHETESIDRMMRDYMAQEGNQHVCPVTA